MRNRTYSRKEFIRKCLSGGARFLGGGLVISAGGGCSSKKRGRQKGRSIPESCEDLSGVSKPEIAKRESFGYVTESTVSGSHCSNCKLYLPPAEEEECGGCLLFDGPVEPNGYCTQYESRT